MNSASPRGPRKVRPGDLARIVGDSHSQRVLEVEEHSLYLFPIYEPSEKQIPKARWVNRGDVLYSEAGQ